MIDKVQRVMEWMATELESYKRRRIFTQKQIQKIVENRRKFENKLQRPSKKLADFLSYANSERNLEKIRNKKISSLGIGPEECDKILETNIFKIYEKALHYYSEPILLASYTEYCIKRKSFDRMKETFAMKCLKNPTDTDLWVYCAQKLWEVDDIEGARNLFLRGTSINRDSRLAVEFFRFECLYANKLNQINKEFEVAEEDRDDVEKGKVALVVFESLRSRMSQRDVEECRSISKLIPDLNEENLLT